MNTSAIGIAAERGTPACWRFRTAVLRRSCGMPGRVAVAEMKAVPKKSPCVLRVPVSLWLAYVICGCAWRKAVIPGAAAI